MKTETETHPTDMHVGTRIRFRRRTLGVSQEKLAESLALTFQQVQKYERGANRVSASKLKQIADALECEVGYFFEGLPGPGAAVGLAAGQAEATMAFMQSGDGMDLAEAMAALGPRTRRLVVKMAQEAAALAQAIEDDAADPMPNGAVGFAVQ